MKSKSLLLTFLVATCFAWAGDEEDTPVMFTDMDETVDAVNARPWKAPDYSKQENALGYQKDTFSVPKGMEERVQFWIDIYSKYNTDQGVLHDSRYVHVVYEPVDFSDIMADTSTTLAQKQKARAKRVKEAKEAIKERLNRLQNISSPEGLEGEDLRYWQMFSTIEGKNKFKEAGEKNRLRFQLGQKDRFVKGIFFSGRYIEKMEEIFREQGVPVELTRLPFVESSFNLQARSRVGASGIWQFMRGTARRLLRMDVSVDERNDPLRATEAAARFLRINYNMLNSWPLAVTAYNHGPAGVARMMKTYKTDSIAELVDERRGRFGFASANFYASFLAALEVERNAAKYFGKVYREAALQGKEVKLTKNIRIDSVLGWFGGNAERAKLYNPHIRSHVWKGGLVAQKNFVRVPPDVYDLAVMELAQAKPASLASTGVTYRVSPGDTLSGIAQQFGVSVRSIIDVNGIENPRGLRAGQQLQIPVKQ